MGLLKFSFARFLSGSMIFGLNLLEASVAKTERELFTLPCPIVTTAAKSRYFHLFNGLCVSVDENVYLHKDGHLHFLLLLVATVFYGNNLGIK